MLIGVLVSSLLAHAMAMPPRPATLPSASARAVLVGETPDSRLAPPLLIAPGAPPVLAFRYYDAKQHKRFDGTGLMLDDAGH